MAAASARISDPAFVALQKSLMFKQYEPLEFDEKDLESEEAVSKLYDRWVLHFRLSRTPAEKAELLSNFKTRAKEVLIFNQTQKDHRRVFDKFMDCELPKKKEISEGQQPFMYDEKDLETDETVSKLYDRWMNHHGIFRSPEEKQRRFSSFKSNAQETLQFNKTSFSGFQRALNHFGDKIYKEEASSLGICFFDVEGNLAAGPRYYPSPKFAKVTQRKVQEQEAKQI